MNIEPGSYEFRGVGKNAKTGEFKVFLLQFDVEDYEGFKEFRSYVQQVAKDSGYDLAIEDIKHKLKPSKVPPPDWSYQNPQVLDDKNRDS